MRNPNFFKLYDRPMRLVGEDTQRKIASLKIGVAGCGIVGQILPPLFSRIGVAEIRTLDKDTVKMENLANSFLFTKDYLGWEKDRAAADLARRYSLRKIRTKAYHFDVTDFRSQHLLSKFISGLDLVYGCFDSLPPRYVLNSATLKKNVKYIDVGVEGFAGRLRFIDRNRACYNCNPLVPEHEAINIFKLSGNKPNDDGCDFAPTVSMLQVALMIASLAVNMGLQFLGIIGKADFDFDYYYFHLFGHPETMKITKRDDCIICGRDGEIWWSE